jgi:hypothetical protein
MEIPTNLIDNRWWWLQGCWDGVVIAGLKGKSR